ncbi:MAG: hypothetical protein RIK87_23260 [Fuerstiella sp.]
MKFRLLKARPKTLLEWLVVAAIVAILAALLIPPAKWASSGSVTIPVDVVVFDAHSAKPIEGAFVAIVRAPPASGEFELNEYQEGLSNGFSAIHEIGVQTDVSGLATIDQEFRTGANHERPISHAHTRWYWVLVSADDYGSVAVPLRYESMATKELKTQGRFPAYVGLIHTSSK